MTTPNHSVSAGIISYYIYPMWWFILIAMILAWLPDFGTAFKWDEKYSKYYQWAHNTKWLYLIPFWNLHIGLDYFTHNKVNGGWKSWAIYVEILLWVMMSPFLLKLLMRLI